MLSITEAIELAEQIYKEKRFLPLGMYDWQADAIRLAEANAFTGPQLAAIFGRHPQYVGDVLRAHFGSDPTRKRRAFSGVAGNFNPESLARLGYLRERWAARRGGRERITPQMQALMWDCIQDGNGLSVISHLTGIPRPTLVKIKKKGEERGYIAEEDEG